MYIFSLSPNFWRLLFLLILACLRLSLIFCMLNTSRCGIKNVPPCPCHIHLEIVTIWIIALPEMRASAIPRVASPMKQKKQWLCVQCLQVPLTTYFHRPKLLLYPLQHLIYAWSKRNWLWKMWMERGKQIWFGKQFKVFIPPSEEE